MGATETQQQADGQRAAPADVHLRGVRKTYADVVAVDHVDLHVRSGEFFTMLGPSGSGKTTCLRMIGGFELPDHGAIEIGGTDVSRQPPNERDVNTVFQDYALFPHMTVARNIEYGLKVSGVAGSERAERVADALAMVRLDNFGDRRPGQLSGGQRQRVALARALVNRPRVLLLDEPLGALDLKLRQELQVELKRIQQEVGITFIYVTHDQDEALSMSDRIAVMDGGNVIQVGTPQDVYDEPRSGFVAGFVGVSNLLEFEVDQVDQAGLTFVVGQGDRIVADASSATTDAAAGDTATVTIRPERIELQPLAGGQPQSDASSTCMVSGTVRESLFAGPTTRFIVDLDGGGELMVVRQNTTTSFEDAERLRGAAVSLIWGREYTRVIATISKEKQ
ncbi:MAG: ABC transporter ATP-binding protein [Thermoleophilaceae bacterium]|nr:ABC transporter ATP-binding protein [Thermoleophilaceae bacterium]